ncbi:IclR family transcriptional regulator [Rhodococcus sp. HNM0569]|uniref:IclR family transcriptional regulator n=1 Tax=Rhodococcus sp. HNM0569 TaxID=2716340 RepID=UPI00146B7C83|nr:IclR family transcriptional regulator [Rhodococcus sp. HNM0569]NLU83784.1 IclR family transcriptional regulator [Rhodococcus sp. HNM0569]
MAILQAFTVERTTLTFAQIRDATGLPKATVHRLLGDLVEHGLLDRTGSTYRLSRLVFELGMRASVERGLIEVSGPFLEELRDRVREIVHLGVREGSEVVYVAKIGAHLGGGAPSRIGGRMPLHATALGKVLLAFSPVDEQNRILAEPLARFTPRTVTEPGRLRRQLDEIRESGLSREYEESAVGVVCVAAPVLDRDDRIVAAVSVTGPTTGFQPERHAGAVRAAARGISATLARRSELTD